MGLSDVGAAGLSPLSALKPALTCLQIFSNQRRAGCAACGDLLRVI
jgi:hypothetical protein